MQDTIHIEKLIYLPNDKSKSIDISVYPLTDISVLKFEY